MNAKSAEVRDFLVTRRAEITPERAGLRHYGGNRRVPGPRREEVPVLDGVSADHYTRVEKGNLAGVSDSVLDAIAGGVAAGRGRAGVPVRPRPRRPCRRAPANGCRATPSTTAAFVRNGLSDILATNLPARALYSPVSDRPARTALPSLARFGFLDPAARDHFPDCALSDTLRATGKGRGCRSRSRRW